ncbi:rap1 GTPase-activating protein 1-like isoform X4 [Clytia hemisphaerica]|uniref:rap1 GTPase-activating protein 1-like isoform X4 n=1 Tax=Clytia hemisphaerica TaxID=252671 RepID=UPI0034D6FF73
MSGSRKMVYSESSENLTDDVSKKFRRRSLVMRDFNRKLKKIKRQVGSFDGSSSQSSKKEETDSLSDVLSPIDSHATLMQEEFLDIISKFQGSRIDDQRTDLPAGLAKQQNLKLDSISSIMESTKEQKKKEPIQEVLACGKPYPMVVLPVEGDYWMEGTYHILSRDMYDRPIFPTIDRSRCVLDDDQTVYNYRRNFAGKEHTNYVGNDSKHGPVLMSVLLDSSQPVSERPAPSPPSAQMANPPQRPKEQFKVILRLKNKTIEKTISPSHFSSDCPGPREIMKYMLEDDVDVDRFHPVVVPRASEEIMRFDEHSVSNCYKIGVLHQKHGQISEEDYLQNPEETPALREFLDCIADRVDLKDFESYRGGLDVKHGQTGEHSYYTNYKEREVMFHVSSMIPYKPNDSQQLSRKRHIGNDVVSIVFQEENTPFCPNSIRSHFLHCFIVVQVENPNSEETYYKVSVAAKEGVPKFAPSLPNPCIFKRSDELKDFLLTKILNAENAAVKSEKFSALAERTRSMLLQGIVTDFIAKNEKMLDDDNLSNGSDNTDTHHVKSGSFLSTFRSAIYRSSQRSEQDNISISSSSSSLPSTLNGSHSLSLNDLNNFDSEEHRRKDMSMSTSPRPGRKTKKDKDKHSKKDRAKSAILSILPPVSHPISEQDFNDLASPTLLQISTKQSPTSSNSNLNEQPTSRPRTRSKFYTNQLFDEFEEPVTLTSTNQISPRCHTMSGGETRKENGSDPSIQQPKISITATTVTSSDEENNNANDPSPSSSSSTDTAKEEIEKLRAEIHKLKIDKMDLIRQNVKLKEQKKSRQPKQAWSDPSTGD